MTSTTTTVDNFLKVIGDLLFPIRCGGCGKRGQFVCGDCQRDLKFCSDNVCLKCDKASVKGHTHRQCATQFTPEKFLSIYTYKRPFSKILQKAKYSPYAFNSLQELLPIAWSELVDKGVSFGPETIVIPIPLHWRRRMIRGFNVSELIARSLVTYFGLTLDVKSLLRIKNTKTQTRLKREERHQNVSGAFKVRSQVTSKLVDKDILLIDDVCTTGATFLSAAKALKEAGCGQVWCLSLAKD